MFKFPLKLVTSPSAQVVVGYLVAGLAWLLLPDGWVWTFFDIFMPVTPEAAKWMTFIVLSGVMLRYVFHAQMSKVGRSNGYARRMQHFARGLIEHCPMPIILKDDAGTIVLVNEPVTRDHKRSEGEIVGKKLHELFPREVADRLSASDRRVMETRIAIEEDFECIVAGKRRIARIVKFPILDEQSEVRGTGTFSIDLTRSKLIESELLRRRYSDDHTGLPNREFVARELPREIERARVDGLNLHVLLVALEGLTRVEAALGQSVADEAFLAAIERIKACAAEGATIAHLRGWDILIVYSHLSGRRRPSSVAKAIIEALETPIDVGGHSIFPTPRVGIATCPKDGADATTLLAKVRNALTDCASDGSGPVALSVPGQHTTAQRRLAIETQLRHALERSEFLLNYQPQMAANGERIVGAEALLRWRNKDLGFVSPSEFIPIAEEAGLINDIERWVLENACREAQAWSELGGEHIRIAVNVSATQFTSQEFVRHVSKVLRETGLPARRLEVEITERLLLKGNGAVSENLKWLSKLNIHLAIDDFGTGYSSLNILKTFPFNVVKIDKSFVDNIVDDAGDLAITKTIIGMAKTLGLSIVAEGVESELQRDLLRDLGVDHLQGYLYSRPISAFEFRQFIRRHAQPAVRR